MPDDKTEYPKIRHILYEIARTDRFESMQEVLFEYHLKMEKNKPSKVKKYRIRNDFGSQREG